MGNDSSSMAATGRVGYASDDHSMMAYRGSTEPTHPYGGPSMHHRSVGCQSCGGGCGGRPCHLDRQPRRGGCETTIRPDLADRYPDRPVLPPWPQSTRANRLDTQDLRGDAPARQPGELTSMHPVGYAGDAAWIDPRRTTTTHPGRHDQQYSPYGCGMGVRR